MDEPPIEFSDDFRYEDVSTWFEVDGITKTDCCEAGFLPLASGDFLECPTHAAEVRFN